MIVQLAPNFYQHEFERSATAARYGIDNSIPDALLPNVREMAQCMQLIRSVLGNKVITVTSGYRCPKLNAKINGSTTSAHMQALACDFIVAGMSPFEVALALRPHVKELKIDQLILEFGEWTHVGISLGVARQQVFSYVTNPATGKTEKRDGITLR